MGKKIKMVIAGAVISSMIATNVYAFTDDTLHRSSISFIEKIVSFITSSSNKDENVSHDFSMYNDIYYYDSNNLSRYKSFSAKNPNISPEDIIWLVNANLDRNFYDKAEKIENTEDEIILVNKYNYLPNDYVPKNLIDIENGKQATEATAKAFEEMKENAAIEGLSINVVSAYRSIDYQKNLYKQYVKRDGKELADTYSARAGYSEHHTGRALDIAAEDMDMNNFGNTQEYKWVAENCWKYGFIIRYTEENKNITGYQSEPWHITYVGTDISGVMHNQNISSLEEYFVKYVDYSVNN